MVCRLKSCPKCHGDLVLDVDEWRCWQCGERLHSVTLNSGGSPANTVFIADNNDRPSRPSRKVRAMRNLNSAITAMYRSHERWQAQNEQIIKYLDQGLTVREISARVGRGERRIRVIREQLNDLRINGEGAA